MTTWRKELELATRGNGETVADLVANTLTDDEMDTEFYDGWGMCEGVSFTAWSDNWVYFPACYDGSEWVASVPRNPSDIRTPHVGGG